MINYLNDFGFRYALNIVLKGIITFSVVVISISCSIISFSTSCFGVTAIFEENFKDTSKWSIYASSSVVRKDVSWVSVPEPGILVDFEFVSEGFLSLTRSFGELSLPDDFFAEFNVKWLGSETNQHIGFEFKMMDKDTPNVWWKKWNNLNIWSGQERIVHIPREEMIYAWGPNAELPIKKIRAMDFVVVSDQALRGQVFISAIKLMDQTFVGSPSVLVSSYQSNHLPQYLVDKDLRTAWLSSGKSKYSPVLNSEWIQLNYPESVRFSGLKLDWSERSSSCQIQVSYQKPSGEWVFVKKLKRRKGDQNSYLIFDQIFRSHSLRLELDEDLEPPLEKILNMAFDETPISESPFVVGINELSLLPVDVLSTPAQLFLIMASERPRGDFPKYLKQEQSYWTSIPLLSDPLAIPPPIFNEEGTVEFGHGFFTIEPSFFVTSNGNPSRGLYNWGNVQIENDLSLKSLPIPISLWRTQELVDLKITGYTSPKLNSPPIAYIEYEYTNHTQETLEIEMNLLVRPIPITPHWQFGDFKEWMSGSYDQAQWDGQTLRLTNEMPYDFFVEWLNFTERTNWTQIPFFSGSPYDYLRNQTFFRGKEFSPLFPMDFVDVLVDNSVPWVGSQIEKSSGVLSHSFLMAPLAKKKFTLAVYSSLKASSKASSKSSSSPSKLPTVDSENLFDEIQKDWRQLLSKVEIQVPQTVGSIVGSLKSAIGHIFANKIGPALEPGPRHYATSWIRDGAIMGSTLLQFGHFESAKTFLQWFSTYQFQNGFVPCCVTNNIVFPNYIEYDSNGQYLYLVAEILRYTKDKSYVKSLWLNVVSSVEFIRNIREGKSVERSFADSSSVESSDLDLSYGLMPKSVSHEGYLGNPTHAYWDDYWTLRGLQDAVYLAGEMDEPERKEDWERLAHEFETDLSNSILGLIRQKNIDYLPASLELVDFDPAGSLIVLSLLGPVPWLSPEILTRTADKYKEIVLNRWNGTTKENKYSAYEMRLIEPLIRLKDPEFALRALQYYVREQRPEAWKQWTEITWEDPKLPTGIGDMPHSWISAEYLKALRSFFIIENLNTNQVQLASGVQPSWLKDVTQPVFVRGMPSPYGTFDYSFQPVSGSGLDFDFSYERKQIEMNHLDTNAEVFFDAPKGCEFGEIRTKTLVHAEQVNSYTESNLYTLTENKKRLFIRSNLFHAGIEWVCK